MDGWDEVKTPHLFCAMIGSSTSPFGALLNRYGFRADMIQRAMLTIVPARGTPHPPSFRPVYSRHVQSILTHARKIGPGNGETVQVDETVLERAFFADGGGVVAEALKQLGLGALLRHVVGKPSWSAPSSSPAGNRTIH